MKLPPKMRVPIKQSAVLSEEPTGPQKADESMEVEPSGELEAVGTKVEPKVIQTVPFYTDQGKNYGTALVARDTKGVIQTLTVFIEGAEYHYNVDHSTQQVAHPINHEQLGQGTAAVSELWPTLQQRVPEALKGHSLSQIQQQTSFIDQLSQAEKRVGVFVTGLSSRRAMVETSLATSLRQIYDKAAPIINGNMLLVDLAEPLHNLFYQPAADGVVQKKALGKAAAAATAKAHEAAGEPAPTGTAPGSGGQGTVGNPSPVPPPGPTPAPLPHTQKPASARTVGRGSRKKKP